MVGPLLGGFLGNETDFVIDLLERYLYISVISIADNN